VNHVLDLAAGDADDAQQGKLAAAGQRGHDHRVRRGQGA
jgi:hypothetical protein